MELHQFNSRDQNLIVRLAIRKGEPVVEFKGHMIDIPHSLNVLYICSSHSCRNTSEKQFYRNDVVSDNITKRINCNSCGKLMTSRYIGTDIKTVLKKFVNIDDVDEPKNLEKYFNVR